MRQGGRQTFFASPHAVTYILILSNAVVFGVTLIGNSLARIDPVTLFHYGALYPGVLSRQEYWRLIAYAFLHANVLHFGLNMLCLAAWSGLLEHRLGATYFLFVYIASAVGGGLASFYGHAEPFLGVGASGAISGIVGGLLCLTILEKLALSPQFFIVTIGVNCFLAARVAHVDWIAHLGGFTAGFAACAVLNSLEGLNRYWLKCKFPEFVKFAIATACLLGVGMLFLEMASASQSVRTHAIEWSVGILLSIKLADFILDHRKGLAILTMGTAVFYGLLPLALNTVFQPYCGKRPLSATSSSALREAARLLDAACEHASFWSLALGLIVSA